jgi:hypothetical protein
MSEVNIDDLTLKISASANDADDALDRLAASLDNLDRQLQEKGASLTTFATRIGNIANALGKMNALLSRRYNLDFKVQGKTDIESVQQAIEKVSSTVDGSEIAQKLAKMFNIEDQDSVKQMQATIEQILKGAAETFDGQSITFAENAGKLMQQVYAVVKQEGKMTVNEVRGDLDETEADLIAFLKDVQEAKIKVNEHVTRQLGGTAAKDIYGQYLSYISEFGKIDDSNASEWAGRFYGYFNDLESTLSDSERVLKVLDAVKDATEQLGRMKISEMPKDLSSEVYGEFSTQFSSMLEKMTADMRSQLQQANNDFATQIKLDIIVDEQKIAEDIRKGLKRAVKLVTEPVPVDLKVNVKHLQDQIKKQIGPVDIGQLPQLAEAIERMNRVDASNILKISQSFGAFGKKQFAKAATNLKAFGVALDELAVHLSNFGKVTYDLTGLTELGKAISVLGRKTITQAIENIPELEQSISSLINTLAKAPEVSWNTIMLVQSLAMIPKAARTAQESTFKLREVFQSFFGTMLSSMKPGLSGIAKLFERGNVLSQTLRVMSSSLKLGTTTMKSLSNAMKTLSNGLKKAAENSKHFSTALKALSAVAKGASVILNGIQTAVNVVANVFSKLAGKLTSAAKPMDKIKTTLRGLLRAIIPIMGIRQIFTWGKQATEISSDLTEVQNVVDTVFQNASTAVDEFASKSIEDFGMAELTAKQMASRYQAMGVAMGILPQQVAKVSSALKNADLAYGTNAQSMADMSIELTKLTADMASFYNVEQEAVSEDLAAIFTGQTRPLMLAA